MDAIKRHVGGDTFYRGGLGSHFGKKGSGIFPFRKGDEKVSGHHFFPQNNLARGGIHDLLCSQVRIFKVGLEQPNTGGLIGPRSSNFCRQFHRRSRKSF